VERTAAAGPERGKKWMKVKLEVRHFRKISDVARDFEWYSTSVRGGDTELAKEHQLRNDELKGDGEKRARMLDSARRLLQIFS
jgi:hypothetical protein